MSAQVVVAGRGDVVGGLVGAGFGGRLWVAGEAEYDVERRAVAPSLDSRPLVVAEAAGRGDVEVVVRVAREYGVPVAVQATGHGTKVPADGGILLKTTRLTGVFVDPERRVARVAPGARWGAVLEAARQFGLAPLSGSSKDVGVTGYTLGGGVGWLARKYGFAADSVLRAEVVTADGRVVTATAEQHPDLFWAIRGGTGNFGIVTALEFRLYPVQTVYAGIVYYGIDRAPELLRRYRDWTKHIPNELSTAVVLTRIPGTEQRAVAIKVLYAGAADLAEHLLKPLFEVAGPRLAGALTTIEYADAAMGGTPTRHLDFLDDLTDHTIDTLVALDDDPTVEIRHWGGAMAHPGPGAGPVGHRAAAYSLIVDRELPPGLLPDSGRTFVNFLGDHGRATTAYAEADLDRLRAVKRAYDPTNFFRLNANIKP
ncbi:FAD-binding oxidoreductase [Kribbella sandramycini]|uniref:FAD-binding oxidoreductase n=1 Tax=Kribbella sandramycini TaxID=60450 RepID=A0A7Y4NZX3_9ACTN|nr:FAD-binding oxidoreductase [Kribbella sandramycini]MBB6565787.1 FAD/FMN-containing dehydrogenase [Kribbella sandramycini]NOL42051.1 FAD-binding oxidoreductase [Kribbella sandramycini]